MQNPPTIRIGGQVSKSLYQYSMQSPDQRGAVRDASASSRRRWREVPGLEDLTSDLEITSPQVNVEIDRDKAAALGVTANQIENAFYDAYGPRWVSTIYAPVNEYKVLLELAPEFQADPSALSMLYFKATPRRRPTSTPAHRAPVVTAPPAADRRAARHAGEGDAGVGPQTVNHYGQLPAVTISFGLAPGASLGDVLARVSEVADADAARRRQRAVPGRGEGVPELARQPRRAAAHRRHGRLHRARHPLRELHPPADDSVGPAVGRRSARW